MKTSNIRVGPYVRDAVLAEHYDLVLTALGYETRARFMAESMIVSSSLKLAIGFKDRHVLAYEQNEKFFRESGFVIQELDGPGLRGYLSATLRSLPSKAGDVRILVDISSFTRERMAIIMAELMVWSPRSLVLDCLYSPAVFTQPPEQLGPIQSFGPATPEFAGWSPDVDKPALAVVGLGYEQDRAVGAIEYLEPGEVWAFIPIAKDQRYARALEAANNLLWQELPKTRQVYYRASRPYDLFVRLESLVYGGLAEHRPVLVPFGPKIFALTCLLLGCRYKEVGVWRVSSGTFDPPLDRVPDGDISGLRVHLSFR